MNTRAIEQFLKVVELRSVSRAATVLGQSQPALSRALRQLEADIGTELLYRDGRGVRLTDQGERFARWAAEFVDQIDQMRRDLDGEAGGRLRGATIGLLPALSRQLAVPLTRALRDLYPDALLRIVEGSCGHLVEWLADGRLDIAIVFDKPPLRRLNPEPVATQFLHLVGAKSLGKLGSTIPFRELADRPLILSSRPLGNRGELEGIAQRLGIELDVVMEVDSLDSLLKLLEAGEGWSILPAKALQEEIAHYRLQAAELIEPRMDRTLVLVLPVNRVPMPGAAALVRAIKSEIQRIYAVEGRRPRDTGIGWADRAQPMQRGAE
ncbi:LysR family transcriptional regulator [Roseomonas sp. HJA6]|uniref:LysR family transcriptional regulator n=1 Tax=Roseomonas alba TaxID=2846776 RepID=A0ABS7ADR8_9PROT|nr:LysR family transcriptional regulator [Neoroseomonas alba]MBW6400453.1 LysR family transcriptional regulator [Neoroseomonas alba]